MIPSILRTTTRIDNWSYHGLAWVKHTENEPYATFSLYHERNWHEFTAYTRPQLVLLRDFLTRVLQEWTE